MESRSSDTKEIRNQLWNLGLRGFQASFESSDENISFLLYLCYKQTIIRTLNLKMLKIFGKNNNQVFRSSQKITYSMPQSLHFSQTVAKCACGFDYIAILTTSGKLYFLFQAKFYQCENVPLLLDLATSQNTLILLTKERELLAWDFDEEKVMNGRLNYSKMKVSLEKQDSIKKVEMGFGDIFLISQNGKLYHFKRNEWYETKSYSNIESVELSNKIIDVSSGPSLNLFISYEGHLYRSTKEDPLHLMQVETNHKFMKVSSSNYNAGITKKGTIMIWGNSIHGSFREPTEFSKLTKKFVDVKLDKENGYALADDGEVWVWGVNSNGQLGLSDYQTRIKPFPLITLEKNHVLDIFSGHSYACCLCEPEQKNDKNTIKVIDRKVTEFSTVRQEARIIKKQKPSKNQNNAIYIEEDSYEVKSKNEGTGPVEKKRKISNKSVEKKSHKKSQSATPSQSPSPAHKRKQSSKVEKKSEISEIKTKLKFEPRKLEKNDWLIDQRESQENSRVHEQNRTLQLENDALKQENERLKEKVSEQADTIQDITVKIRLLEQAIDEHERTLTSRDHILQEYQCKEQEHIDHINKLQRTIDEIVRYKQKNNEVMVIYEDLKNNFEKQRSYYIDKIKDYEIKFHIQEEAFKRQIEQLKKKQAVKQAVNKENSKPWQSHSPIMKKSEVPYFRGEMMERNNNSSMDHVIDQIEENRSRITKSANKLIAMLDISQ